MNEKSKLNVLITTSSFFRDKEDDIFGGGNFVFELAKGLSKENNIFILAPMSDISKKKDSLLGITIYRFKQFFINSVDLAFGPGIIPNIRKNKLLIFTIPYFILSQLFEISKIVKKEKIDLIHSNWLLPQGLIAAIYKTLFNKKIELLTTIHGSDVFGLNNTIVNKLKKFAIQKADKITVVSSALKEKLNELVPEKNVEVLPMGINIDLFKIQNKNLNLINKYGNNFKYIIFVGAVIKEKGIFELIEAMKIVVDENSNIKLLVIGDGNSKVRLIQYVNENNLQNNIEFLGFIENKSLPEYYSISNLLILPSYSEGFGLVVAEAMACGVKPIVSNLPTFKDFVSIRTGVFLNSINPEDIANNILKLIESEPNNFEKEEIRKIIVEKYSWMTVINNYYKIYKN